VSEMITEKYRPQRTEDLIGNEDSIKLLKESILKKEPTLVYGNPGVGKTSTVYVIAKENSMKVIEVNASDEREKRDLEDILIRAKTRSFKPLLFLLDEVDGVQNWSLIENIIKTNLHPVVLVANQIWVIPEKIQKLCKIIKFKDLYLADVVSRVRKVAEVEGQKPDYSKITSDVRSSLLGAFYGSEKYEIEDNFKKIYGVLRYGKIEDVNEHDYLWLMDNFHIFYSGRDLFEACQLLALASRLGRKIVLKLLPKGRGRVRYPYYLRRIKVMREKEGQVGLYGRRNRNI